MELGIAWTDEPPADAETLLRTVYEGRLEVLDLPTTCVDASPIWAVTLGLPELEDEQLSALRDVVRRPGRIRFLPVAPGDATHDWSRVNAGTFELVDGRPRATDARALREIFRIGTPLGTELAIRALETDEGTRAYEPILVEPDDRVNGDDIAQVEAQDMDGHDQLYIQLDPAGTEEFAALTASLVNRQLAVEVDGYVVMTPHVQEPIERGNILVHPGTSDPEATERTVRRWVALLQPNHALPDGVRRVEINAETTRDER